MIINARRGFVLVVLCFFALVLPAAAQGSEPLVAFVNSGGQLIVSSGDGSYRWIVTNPGETLVGNVMWVSNGTQLLFAVGTREDASLRAADVRAQVNGEIGRVSGVPISVSADGASLFVQQGNGSYAIQPIGGAAVTLPLSNDRNARYSGLWADSAPLVAYWGFAGNSQIAVTNAQNGVTVTLDSGRSTPITPLAWRPNTTQLIYRDASGFVRIADLACLLGGCSGNPLEDGAALLPADVTDVTVDAGWVYYRSGTNIGALDLACVQANNCSNTPGVVIAGDAAPQTGLQAAGSTLVYTGFGSNVNDVADRQVRVLDASCRANPSSCAPTTLINGGVAGAVSANGRFAVVEQVNGGLSSVDLASGAAAYLSDRGASINAAYWQ